MFRVGFVHGSISYRVMVFEITRWGTWCHWGGKMYTKYMAESAKLEGGNLRLGWEIPGHLTLCMKH